MDTKYVISLDTLDMSLLPFSYQYRHNMPALWSRDDDFREFTVHVGNTSPSDQSAKEESTPQTKKIETIVCHMCKVDVPKQFLKEHNNSPKHTTYTKIANIALQRIKEHMIDKCDCAETEVDKLTYFCSHCIAVVNNSERRSHENSDTHKNSVFLDKCLSNFLDLYSNFDKTDNDDKNSNVVEDTSKSEKNEHEGKKFDIKNYFEALKNKYKMSMKYKIIDDEKLELEVDGRTLEVAVHNFLGLKATSSDSLECVVCKEVVEVKDKVEHIMKAKHMYRVSISFKDIHCKREIYPSWYHCVLCNVITDNSNIHTISDTGHQKLLQEALKFKSKDNSKENSISSESWTLVTNNTNKSDATTNKDSSPNQYSVLVDTDNNSMASKDEISSTANKTFCSHCNVYISTKNWRKHIGTNKHLFNAMSKYYYLFKNDINIITCKVCDVVVNDKDFERHVNFSEHENKYNALLATNKVRKIDNVQFFCGVCDILVLVKNELYHIKGKEHIQNLDLHRESSPATSDYHCSVCDVRVPNTVSDIQTHNQSSSHNAKKLTTAIDSVSTVKSTISTSLFYNYTMLETQFPTLVNCTVCDILVTKDEELVQNHVESENHLQKYEKLLQDHKLVLQNDNIYCHICKVFVGLKSEIMHIRGKKHLKNINKAGEKTSKSPSVEDTAKLETQVKVEASGLTINDDDMNVILKDYDISDNLKELICKTCNVNVPFTIYNSSGHLGGSKHKQKLTLMEMEMKSQRNYSSPSFSSSSFSSSPSPSPIYGKVWNEYYGNLED